VVEAAGPSLIIAVLEEAVALQKQLATAGGVDLA
jgi:hypothetical protein